jgi:hypothetical protein
MRLMRAGQAAAGLVAAASFVTLAATAPASGYVLNPAGCKWAGFEPQIGYRFESVTAPYITATYDADSARDATSAPGFFYEGSLQQVLVYDRYAGSNQPDAWVSGNCGSNKIWITPLTLTYNQTRVDAYSASKKKALAVHEFGHLYGLAHAPSHRDCHNQVGHAAQMIQGYEAVTLCGWTNPSADDVAGAVEVYS